MDTINAATIRFNRILAKHNFKYEDINIAVQEVIKTMLSESPGLRVTNSTKEAKEIVNPSGELKTQRNIAAVGYLYLKDESAVYMRLFQYNAFGFITFVYVVDGLAVCA